MPQTLVIGDDVLMNRVLMLLLGKHGHAVTIAQNESDALRFLQQGQFNLVITDILLSFANGMELISRLKESAAGRSTAVMVISALADEKSIQNAFALGVADYMVKPIAPAALMERINKVLTETHPAGLSSGQ